jgi:hypothetical protein
LIPLFTEILQLLQSLNFLYHVPGPPLRSSPGCILSGPSGLIAAPKTATLGVLRGGDLEKWIRGPMQLLFISLIV